MNLGIGIPTLVANYIPAGIDVTLQSRERHARHGAVPDRGARIDPDLINAGKETVTTLPGRRYFSSRRLASP